MISIIMPVYNTAPFLEECLESICRQSFLDWELIAVDDFSTDASKSILDKYSQLDPRIAWYANDEKGIIPALKKAYGLARGEMIHRMDSDDVMPIEKLENLYSVLEERGHGSVATGKVEYFSSSWEVRRGFRDYASWINHHIDQKTIFDDVFMECPIASPAWLMYRKDMESIGGIIADRYPEDYDLVFRMYHHGLQPYGYPGVVHLWRDWSERASRTKKEYADQLFFDLKLYYFMKYKYRSGHSIVLWGAGSKGKKLCKKILAAGIKVIWVTENKNKIGHNIYGTILQEPGNVISGSSQIIVAVSNPEHRNEIRKNVESTGKRNNEDLFFFC